MAWGGGWSTTGGGGGGNAPIIPSPPNQRRWLFVGDSLTEGKPGVGRWQDKLAVIVNDPLNSYVTAAAGGAEVVQILALWRANDIPTPGKLFVLGGTNDIYIQQSAAGPTFATLTTIYQEAQALGAFVIASTIPPFGSGSFGHDPARQANRDALNALIRASPDVDMVVDLYAELGEPGNPTDFNPPWVQADGIHPNEAGTTEMAAIYAAALGF